ncbi:hypothetical protein NPIL_509581 [Nephila pilipes]|uniref:Uncharacterized protein n=1 Tax=Nephila pilipes TaxID=299642 RepID=A0A8X6N4T8_NEPPI|nr:hypothetical protein NPIL_509581 [Nephila pilipes]
MTAAGMHGAAYGLCFAFNGDGSKAAGNDFCPFLKIKTEPPKMLKKKKTDDKKTWLQLELIMAVKWCKCKSYHTFIEYTQTADNNLDYSSSSFSILMQNESPHERDPKKKMDSALWLRRTVCGNAVRGTGIAGMGSMATMQRRGSRAYVR